MSFAVGWDNVERTIIRSDVIGDWTWDDFILQIKASYALMYTVDHTVDVIAYGMGDWMLPPGDMMIRLRSVRGERPPNMGRLVLVNVHPFVRAAAGVMSKVYPQNVGMIHFVETLDEARALLASDPAHVR